MRSAAYLFVIKRHQYAGYINGRCRLTIHSNGVATGCYVTASATAYVSKGKIGLFTGSDGTGCLAAGATFHGKIYAGQIIPVTYYATGNC